MSLQDEYEARRRITPRDSTGRSEAHSWEESPKGVTVLNLNRARWKEKSAIFVLVGKIESVDKIDRLKASLFSVGQ